MGAGGRKFESCYLDKKKYKKLFGIFKYYLYICNVKKKYKMKYKKKLANLAGRIKAWENLKGNKMGFKKPGSQQAK